MSPKIVANFLNPEQFKKIQTTLVNNQFPWYYQDFIEWEKSNWSYYFVHIFYDKDKINSEAFSVIQPILDILKPKSLIRVKANFYPSTEKLVYHKQHSDHSYKHKGLIFYVNSNNGYTITKDGTKIKSIENTGWYFDPSQKHSSTTCTNQKGRININFNYF